jgi:hypothetical protein
LNYDKHRRKRREQKNIRLRVSAVTEKQNRTNSSLLQDMIDLHSPVR